MYTDIKKRKTNCLLVKDWKVWMSKSDRRPSISLAYRQCRKSSWPLCGLESDRTIPCRRPYYSVLHLSSAATTTTVTTTLCSLSRACFCKSSRPQLDYSQSSPHAFRLRNIYMPARFEKCLLRSWERVLLFQDRVILVGEALKYFHYAA